jgi:hypothetical protein
METLPVIFRNNKGDIYAVFPTIPSNYGGYFMQCYAQIGQHSGCSIAYYRDSKPATIEQYKDLLAELKRIYETGDDPVTLVIKKRISPAMRSAFVQEQRRLTKETLAA